MIIIVYVGSTVPLFANIPAAVYGFASTFAYLLLGDKFSMEGVIPGAITVVISLLVGQAFGIASSTISGKLTKAE